MPKSTMTGVKAGRNVLQFEDIDALVEDTNRLLDSVYSMVNTPRCQSAQVISPRCQSAQVVSPRSRGCQECSPKSTAINSDGPQSPKSARLSSTSRSTSAIAPPRPSSEIELEINRISRFCQALEDHLDTVNWQNSTTSDGATAQRSPAVTSPNSPTTTSSNSSVICTANIVTPPRADCGINDFIDLSDEDFMQLPLIRMVPTNNYDNDDDEVICVTPSTATNSIVDLCTPTQPRRERNNRYGRNNSRSVPLQSTRRNTNAAHCPQSSNSNARMAVSATGSSSWRSRSPAAVHSSMSRCSVQTSTTSILNAAADEAKGSSSSPALDGRTPFMCAVCMECCVNNQPTSTKCGHVFCEQCIREAVRLTRKCPMCNTRLTARMLLRIYV